jgi:ribosome maturation factor RimP
MEWVYSAFVLDEWTKKMMVEKTQSRTNNFGSSSTVVCKAPMEQELIAKVEPVVESLGFTLRDLEVSGLGSRGATVRVIVDRVSLEAENVGIEDCVRVHETLGPLFDVWDPIETNYTLEVSSPGEKPSLRTLGHFQEHIGDRIRFETSEPLPMPAPAKPRKRWDGLLKSVDTAAGTLFLTDDWGEHTVPLSMVKDAEAVMEWSLGQGKESAHTDTKEPAHTGKQQPRLKPQKGR